MNRTPDSPLITVSTAWKSNGISTNYNPPKGKVHKEFIAESSTIAVTGMGKYYLPLNESHYQKLMLIL
jgi:hypothetical protein